MSEQTTDLATTSQITKLKEFLAVRHNAAVAELDAIQSIVNDQQYEEAEESLTQAKGLYDMMSARRKQFTDPIKKAIEEIMVYENAINYTAKSENSYNRARKVLDDYNQKKIDAKKVAEHEAWLRSEQMKYKAEYKAKIQDQLLDKLSGLHKNVLQAMVDWEKKMTLENIEEKTKNLRDSQPKLKEEHYNECFRRWNAKPMIMGPDQEDAYLAELKKELPYGTYNEKFQQLIAPLKNEYLARVGEIKTRLEELAKVDAKKQAEMKAAQETAMKKKMEEDLAAASKKNEQDKQIVQDEKDVSFIEADFTEQAMTSDIDAGPSKKVARFENDAMWLTALLQVIGKVAVHPKFKGIMAKDGYVPEVKKWLDFYSANIGEPLKGLTFDEVAKTIVRKK